MEDYMKYILNDYIENEIDYIKQDLNISGYSKDLLQDLNYLENITELEKNEIVEKMLEDNELEQKINELIHLYLYG